MSSNESSRKSNVVFRKNARLPCNCGWEVRFGYGVAVTLTIFEAKRFFMLILEIFAEWQIIRFAGGLRPVIFTLINVSLGLPTALITVRSIRARKVPRCCAETRRTLKCLLIVIAICAVMNVATLVSIGYYISVRQETLIDVFNSSMHLYISASSYKYAIDEIQFIFQCCGHSSYADWFRFDWQGVDYASREEMSVHNSISDEEYRDRSVPFSCCNLRTMAPCEHTEIQEKDMRTINANGCAEIVSPVLLRIVIVAYVMTSTLVIIQVFLAFLITKIIRKLLCGTCRMYHFTTFVESTTASEGTSSESERRYTSSSPSIWRSRCLPTKRRERRRRTDKRTKYVSTKDKATLKDDSSSSMVSSPKDKRSTPFCGIAAMIRPSAHEQHTISRKQLCDSGTR
ncbi:peripherin-2-like [Ceratina calcarata]|uniref:Peripherin-2-like n=1 Tax=Ceratina calcarata TaxID=156304 RepID=A0AAJ7J265_9HYME|nr:peripherin-2-like [Ceratina calcarata]